MSFNLIGCSFFVLELPPPLFPTERFRIDTNESRGEAFQPFLRKLCHGDAVVLWMELS
jgi:hypothetical protein